MPKREVPFDVLVSGRGLLTELPKGATVGTGSLRRRAQLLHARPDLEMRDIRGNVDTRLAKLAAGEFDAIVLAQAGLLRLQLDKHITQIFEPSIVLPAVGQGALGIETRADDRADASAGGNARSCGVPCRRAGRTGTLGRTAWRLLGAGAPAHSEPGQRLRLDAVVLSADGRNDCSSGEKQTQHPWQILVAASPMHCWPPARAS